MNTFDFFLSLTPRNSLKTSVLSSTLGSALLFLCFADQSHAGSTIISNLEQYDFTQTTPTVDELSDVEPNNWAFEALQSLVSRYKCLTGDPRGRYFGQRTLTRFEFAAALNACLLSLERQLEVQSGERFDPATLKTLQRLQSDFADELEALSSRLDTVEAQVSQIEAQQFAPTTKLQGEAIFAFAGVTRGNRADDENESIDANVILANRIRLNFDTSFTGHDQLRIRLQARNIPEFENVMGTQMANLSFDGANGNVLEISDLEYRFPIGNNTRVSFSPVGVGLRDYVPAINPYFGSSGKGSISTFGRENPITRQGGGAGFGVSHDFNDIVNVGVGYVANNAENPTEGLFADRFGAIAQLTLTPAESVALGLTYVRSFNNFDTGTGSELTSDPFDDESEAITANSWTAEVAVDITSGFNLGGRMGLIQATAKDLENNPTADIFTWAVQASFPDLGLEDSLLGLVVGQPPKVTRNQFGNDFEDRDTSLHLEAFYRLQVTDNIGITPGTIVILNPEHNDNNDTINVWTIRTTFRF